MIVLKHKFLQQAERVSEHSTCLRRKVGAVLVKDNTVIMSGYNTSPNGGTSCKSKGLCLRNELKIPSGHRQELCFAIHAEQMCITRAARCGVRIDGSVLYCTHSPCAICSKLIIDSGIKEVNYYNEYPDDLSFGLLEGAHVRYFKINRK